MGRRSRSEISVDSSNLITQDHDGSPVITLESSSSSSSTQDGCDPMQFGVSPNDGTDGHAMGGSEDTIPMEDVELLDENDTGDDLRNGALDDDEISPAVSGDASHFTFHWGDQLIHPTVIPSPLQPLQLQQQQRQATPRESSSAAMNPRILNTKQRGLFLHLERDLLTVSYHGPGNQNVDVGCIQADAPFSSRSGNIISYFEVTIRNIGKKNKITIGLTVKDYVLSRLPGWERGSYGYHANGKAVNNASGGQNPDTKTFGPQFEVGDIVGCGIIHSHNDVFFTHNGTYLGVAFSNVPPTAWYPSIGLHSPGERVTANFGFSAPPSSSGQSSDVSSSSTSRPSRTSFKFDIDNMIDDERNRILTTEVVPLPVSFSDVHSLVRSHLLYCGFENTLRALDATAKRQDSHDGVSPHATTDSSTNSSTNGIQPNGPSPSHRVTGTSDVLMSTICDRKRLSQYVIAGEAIRAIQESEKLFPGLFHAATSDCASTSSQQHTIRSFDARGALRIRLYCVHLVELIRRRKVEEALQFARQNFADQLGHKIPAASASSGNTRSAEIEQLITDCVGLLAYENPFQTPYGWLLRKGFRQNVADELNRCILEYLHQDRFSTLERVLTQLVTSKRCLREQAAQQEEQYWRQHYAMDL